MQLGPQLHPAISTSVQPPAPVENVLYYILLQLTQYVSAFRIVRYISFRAAAAAVTALLVAFVVGPVIVPSACVDCRCIRSSVRGHRTRTSRRA
jgi:hypothetical protein